MVDASSLHCTASKPAETRLVSRGQARSPRWEFFHFMHPLAIRCDVHSNNRHDLGPGGSIVYSVAQSYPAQIISNIETVTSAMCDHAVR